MIAIVLVHYQHAALTERCLQSLLQQLQGSYRIYVVDNASDNGSLQYLQHRFANAPISWLPQHKNLGFGEGCNRGIEQALTEGAEGVLLLNNDTWITQDLMGPLQALSQRYGHKAILSGEILLPDGRRWYSGGNYSLWRVSTQHHSQPLFKERQTRFVSGCLMYLPRAVYSRIGGFDPAYFLYLEDLALCLKAQQAGVPLICSPGLQVVHQPGATTGGSSGLGVYYQNRNRWLLLHQFGSWFHWPVFVGLYLLGLLKRSSRGRRERQLSLQALRDAWLGHWGRQQT